MDAPELIGARPNIPDMIDTKTAARMLGVTPRMVQRLADRGDITAVRVGRRLAHQHAPFPAEYGIEWHEIERLG